MMFKRFGTIAATAITGTLLLTACNGVDGAADATVSQPAAGATQAAGAIGRYSENKPGARYFTTILTGDNEVPGQGQAGRG
ncbi:hypothetical protein ACRAWF_19245 [Streptomyces sp. L7]